MEKVIPHPGRILKQKLDENKMSQKDLATRTGVTEKHISTILKGDRDITSSFAIKLWYVFENAKFWLNLQQDYDEYQMKVQEENHITSNELDILKEIKEPLQFFEEHKMIERNITNNQMVLYLRSLFQVSNLTLIPNVSYNAAYRAQIANNIRVNQYVLFAWQTMCEKLSEAQNNKVKKNLNVELLKSKMQKIKMQMFEKIDDAIDNIKSMLGECGIKFLVVKNFRGAPVQGFIKKIAENQVLLCITIRGKRADVFWFTLFHELGHIINGDYENKFVDFEKADNHKELKADEFACNLLINYEDYKNFVKNCDYTNWVNITSFAREQKVIPSIVIGRLQKDGFLDWSEYSDKIAQFEWSE